MIYSSIIQGKDGSQIPLFANGKPMHSKYNPQNEANLFSKDISGDFFIILGIGGAYHIQAIKEKNPECFIIAAEENEEDLVFLNSIPTVSKLSNEKTIIFTSFNKLKETLLTKYNPVVFQKISILKHRSWCQENLSAAEKATSIIQETIKEISADFSVQNHFGKLWNRNILLNIKNNYSILQTMNFHPSIDDTKKTAAIIAAGPSLDESIKELTTNRNKYYIFSTDTAYGTLIKNNIIPEIVVSVDAQNVSRTHFQTLLHPEKTTFCFDISCSGESINHISKLGGKIYFVKNNHPLSCYLDKEDSLLKINSGSGTVTIAACDLALKKGFKTFCLFGSDFSYNSGKPYAKGTYLDNQFLLNNSKKMPQEQLFSKLMFRTELIPLNNPKLKNPLTTPVMETYRATLETWATNNGLKKECNTLKSTIKNSTQENGNPVSTKHIISSISTWNSEMENAINYIEENKSIPILDTIKNFPVLFTLFPLISNLKKKEEYKTLDFLSILKLAHSLCKQYT